MIVCDSNVLIAAFIFPGGFPDKIWRSVVVGKFTHATSPDIISEIRRVLEKKFKLDQSTLASTIKLISDFSKLVYPTARVSRIKNDDADNRILECAVSAQAKWIISGDQKHVLPIKDYQGITIVSPKIFAITHGLT